VQTLALSSPPKRGDAVKHAQLKLNGQNVYKNDYGISQVDGVYGEETARAAKRAKYWLGYPLKEIKGTYGDKLDGLLAGKALPPTYAQRRRERIAAYGKTPLREKALKRAKTQLGTTENPRGSNKQKFGLWYGMNGVPWCAIFCTWCYVQEGGKAMARGSRYAYVPWIVNAARAGNYGFSITRDPKPGDLVCYDWEGNGVSDHVGLFERSLGDQRFTAIEGNTAVGNDSNGGEVMRRERNRSQVQAFVHVAV